MKFKIGNKVYVPTPSHGLAEARIVNIKDDTKSVSIKYVDEFIKELYGNDEIVYMDSNIDKIVQETKRPLFWMSQNKKEFPEWITEAYTKYKNNGAFFMPRQKFIRYYLGNDTPYRGLLLYHGLGSGKTCAAVAVCENLKDTRNIVIMLPKSIKENFKKEIRKCGTPKSNKNIENIYSFITYNASTVLKQIEEIGSLHNKTIIVDEVHNLATLMVNGLRGIGKQGYDIYKKLYEAVNSKIVFLSGTPIVNTPFEIAMLFNILRGPLEVIIFKITLSENMDDYLSVIIKDERIEWADLNRKNQSLYVILKLNSWDMEFEQTIRFIETTSRQYNFYVNYERTDSFSLFPESEEEFESLFIKDDVFMNKDMFQRRIIGLTSFYKNDEVEKKEFPEQYPDKIVRVEMSPHQFNIYEKAREFEKPLERRAAKKTKNKKVTTLARVFSREFSNFVFPDEIIRPFKKLQFISDALEEKMLQEKDEEEVEINKDKYNNLIEEALVKVSDPTKPYLKPGKNGLSKYSPKMEEMLNEINKSEKELILVYSAYRNMEGLEIFSRVLHLNGYEQYPSDKKYDYKRYAFFSGNENIIERKKIIEAYVHPENKYGKDIRIILISSAGAEGLDLKNIRKVLIMEPYWHTVRLDQIIGRAVRKNSHYELLNIERNVQPIIYLSVLSKDQIEQSKEKISTDEHIYNVAQKKLKMNVEVLKAVQESAVDCILNNDKCYKFKGKGLAFMPQISDDIIYGYDSTKRTLVVAGMTELDEIVYLKDKNWFYGNGKKYDGKPTLKGKKYGANLERFELFDYDSVKQGKPILIGKINQTDSKINEL